jgi:23S rRNA (cytosine1962-C5)-methyltransferase
MTDSQVGRMTNLSFKDKAPIGNPSDANDPPQVILKPRHALPFFKRHPWVFVGAIRSIHGEPQAGDEVALVSHEGQVIARGLFNPHSQIRVRLYSWDADKPLDREFWKARLQSALQLRQGLFGVSGGVTAYRLVNSEADGLSGLTVDRYDRWLSMQFTSLALSRRQETFVELLRELAQPAGLWLRTEKGMHEAEGLEISDGLLWGEPPPRPLTISEYGLHWEVDLTEGQKTGTYLDQRDNRRAVARLVAGHRLLDVFCYAGGFGIGALVWGHAREVLAIDSSETALTLARRNAELNGVANRWRGNHSDGFKALEQLRGAGERFDTVVLDPPKLARGRAALPQALRAYHSLNHLAVSVLKPEGLLVTCCCSGLVRREDFEQMLADVAIQSRRHIRILEARGAAPDHPRSPFCPENDYLKCYVCSVE